MQPGRGVRVPVPDPPDLWQHQGEQQDRRQDQPPQVADQLAVHEPGGDERREVRRVCHLVRAGEPVPAEPLDLRDDLADDVVAERGVERVARVVEAVVRVDLVAVLDPDPLAVRQHAGRRRGTAWRRSTSRTAVRRLQVPGQVAVVVADRVDDLPAALGHRAPGPGTGRRARSRMSAAVRAGEGQHLHDVAGQHHGQRRGLGGEPAGDDLAARPETVVRSGGRCRSLIAMTLPPGWTVTSSRSATSSQSGGARPRSSSFPRWCPNAVPGQTDR